MIDRVQRDVMTSIPRIPCGPTTRHSNHDRCDPHCGEYTLVALVAEAHETALAKGWWDDYLPRKRVFMGDGLEDQPDRTRAPNVPPDSLAAKCMLIVTEVAEAVECVRDGDMYARTAEDGNPEGFPSELADIVIRVADLCGALGIDLDEAVRIKLAYNRTRQQRHGGRAL